MATIELYSGAHCPYCVRAKSLLKQRGMDFVEYDVRAEPEKREEMLQRSNGARTIPQIFINGRHVGGCDDLYALDKKGELEKWVANA
ncbi:MAG: glutaredoxin 3 [Mariprofundaceae bacterium]|nr:glutaredoxin 3 [Mariprofundaceae bacterium]